MSTPLFEQDFEEVPVTEMKNLVGGVKQGPYIPITFGFSPNGSSGASGGVGGIPIFDQDSTLTTKERYQQFLADSVPDDRSSWERFVEWISDELFERDSLEDVSWKQRLDDGTTDR